MRRYASDGSVSFSDRTTFIAFAEIGSKLIMLPRRIAGSAGVAANDQFRAPTIARQKPLYASSNPTIE